MICTCRDCQEDYENDRDYRTSICDECFKRFNEDNLQPLKDKIHEMEQEMNVLMLRVVQLTERLVEEDSDEYA